MRLVYFGCLFETTVRLFLITEFDIDKDKFVLLAPTLWEDQNVLFEVSLSMNDEY